MSSTKAEVDTLKELLVHNLPAYPVKRSYLVDMYGSGVMSAITELMAENKVLRVKRGYYSLSDELLDEYAYDYTESFVGSDDEEIKKELMPTETLKVLLGAFISQFSVKELVSRNLSDLLKEVPYYTTMLTGSQDDCLDEKLEDFVVRILGYNLTSEGERLLGLLVIA